MPSTPDDPAVTRPSIFLRLVANQTTAREFAWGEFHSRYAPIIAAFARSLGAGAQDVEDVVQDVMLGFFGVAPRFVYDPRCGRFRGYLKTCVLHVLQRCRAGPRLKCGDLPLDQVSSESDDLDRLWEKEWQEALLRRAIDELRREHRGSRTLLAFELHVLERQDSDLVAARLGITPNAVQQAKSRMIRELRTKVRRLSMDE